MINSRKDRKLPCEIEQKEAKKKNRKKKEKENQ